MTLVRPAMDIDRIIFSRRAGAQKSALGPLARRTDRDE